MKLLSNSGSDRVLEWLHEALAKGGQLDVATPELSLFAFSAIESQLAGTGSARWLLPPAGSDLSLLGGPADRASRNLLLSRGLASRFAEWLVEKACEVRHASGPIPQGMLVARDADSSPRGAAFGTVAFSTAGFGLTPGSSLALVQRTESAGEAKGLAAWFESHWNTLPGGSESRDQLLQSLRTLAETRSPAFVWTHATIKLPPHIRSQIRIVGVCPR